MNVLLRGLSAIVGVLPDAVLRLLSTVGAWLLFSVLGYRRAVIAQNIQRAFPNASADLRGAIAANAGRHLFLTLLEFLKMPTYASARFEGVCRIEGMEHLDAATAQGRGVLVLTGHLGSFELGAGTIAMHLEDRKVWLVVKSFPEGTDKFVTYVRERCTLGVIRAKGGMKQILRALKDRDAVAFVLDQNATKKLGVFVDFFGEKACTMAALAVIAERTKAPVIGTTSWRETDGTHVFRMYEAIPFEAQATREETVRHMTQIYTNFIEDRIREHPEQWLWSHRRYKTRPPSPS